ncbi:energy-coupling factor transporter transmembrane component T family protein [Aerococcus urinae]
MKNKFIMGRYLNGDSIVHRMDPRAKLIIMFILLIFIFFANNGLTYGILGLLVVAFVWLTGISLKIFLKGLKPMILLILITVALQLFFTRTGEVYWQWGFLAITDEGLWNALFIFLRFVYIIFISTILTLTTKPLDITDGLESLMKPLKNILPVHEIALMLSIALRFVPTLLEETDKIMDAQWARGVDFSEGSLMSRIKAIIPILVPLFVSAFDRAYDLSIAMEARGYQGGEGRTKYRLLHWHQRDTMAIGLVACVCLAILIFRS